MEVVIFALALGFLVLIVWSSKRLNRYSETYYGYTPISLSTIALAMIPYVLLVAGFVFFKEDPTNKLMAVIIGTGTIIGLFWWLEHHSSFFVALGAIVILLVAGIVMFIVLILLFNRDNDNYYYYHDD